MPLGEILPVFNRDMVSRRSLNSHMQAYMLPHLRVCFPYLRVAPLSEGISISGDVLPHLGGMLLQLEVYSHVRGSAATSENVLLHLKMYSHTTRFVGVGWGIGSHPVVLRG